MILVIGGSGALGKYLHISLQNANIPYETPNSEALDITSELSTHAFFKNSRKYSAIFLIAANTDVDMCEKNPSVAYKVNALGASLISKYSGDLKIPLFYISTSAVFGGGNQKFRYCELDSTNPMNLYGASKLAGENFIKYNTDNYLIVRSSWMIGGGPKLDKKFISRIIHALQANNEISVVHDKFGSLTYAKHLADFLVTSYKEAYRDIIHFSSKNYANRYDIAVYLASLLDSKSNIIGVDSAIFPLSAPRAISEALYSVVPYLPPTQCTWQEIIKDYLNEWL
jgi:dTDP-4-dehydrorhamnose reductase